MKTKLDRTDYGIIAALSDNARLSNKELAARVGLAPSTCLERVRRLRESGVLRGFHAEIDPASVGVGLQAMVAVRLRRHSREFVDAFRRHARTLPEAVGVYHIAGDDDFLVHVAVRDAEHLRAVAMDAFTRREEVATIRTSIIYERSRSEKWPLYPPEDV